MRSLFTPLTVALVVLMASAPVQAETTVRIGKPQAATFPFVPVDVGIATGIFKKHGIDLESHDFAGGPRVQQAITAGALDIAIGSVPELALTLKGVPEIAVAAMADAPYAIVLAVPKDGAKSVSELKGKTVSISSAGSLTDWLGQNLSRQQGWGTDGIKLVPLGSTAAQTAALKTHQIDGMIVEANGGYRLEEEGAGRVLVQFGDLIHPFHVYLLFARRAFAEQNPDAVKAFLAGWFETVTYMVEHRPETIAIMQRTADVSQFIATRDYDAMIGMFNRTGHFNPEALEVVSRSFVEMGLLPTEPDMTKLITEKYLPMGK
ncbi:MAG TPA: ABC transporter substrate-binding protein [Xanthobacteraceae bacterium]|nr:ABC transporter substrate-binding protein [Xanthobacteraceae bacterium]